MSRSILLPITLSLCFATGRAQLPAAANPVLTPQAAYEQATQPFEIIRRAPQNWSDIELAALKTAKEQAKASCRASSATNYSGDDLIAYARLCTLGEEWESVRQAATSYIEAKQSADNVSTGPSARNLATAFDYEIGANIRLQNLEAAVLAAQTMLRTVPYDDLVSEATNSTVLSIQFSHTDEALGLLNQRQPLLLSMLRAHTDSNTSEAPGLHPALPLRSIFSDALALPTMQQFAGQPQAAAASYAALEGSLPPSVAPDDAVYIAESRRRYKLLGSKLPVITTFSWLLDPAGIRTPPPINSAAGSATVLLLFPDWCHQCVALNPTFMPTWRRLREDDEIRFFALLAQAEAPPRTALKEVTKPSTKSTPIPGEKAGIPHVDLQLDVKPTAAALLVETPTFVVPNETLTSFAASDFPLIIVADHDGIIRSIQVATDNAMVPGGIVDQTADHVVHTWPLPQP